MNPKRIKLIGTIVAILFFLNPPSPTRASSSEKKSALDACRQLFGALVDESLNLFEINQFYVLQVKFGDRGRLEELTVVPKYYFAEGHPDWEESKSFVNLSAVEFESLLARLDAVKPKGDLVRPPSTSPVTNMTLRQKAVYEHAVLEWGEVLDLRRGEDAPLEVRWISLKYQKIKAR